MPGETLFVVDRPAGAEWVSGKGAREQPLWDEHAAFMDDLADKGSIILGGPLEGDRETMQVIAAESEQAVRDLFATDPWWVKGMLRPVAIERWTILLDSRK